MTEPAEPGIVAPGAGHVLTARGSVMAFKAVAAQTGGDFSLMERTLPPGGRRPPAHRHVNCSEAFFVLDGQISFTLDGQDLTGGPGDFLLVPRGAAHTFGNASPEPARLLGLHAPAMHGHRAGARADGPVRHGARLRPPWPTAISGGTLARGAATTG